MVEDKRDKEFLENLDRMLSGRDEKIDGTMDEDTRSALDFARKLSNMAGEPSEDFKQNLKAKLVHRLAEQDKEKEPTDPELAYWGVKRRKRWQGTLAALITVIILAVILVMTLLLIR